MNKLQQLTRYSLQGDPLLPSNAKMVPDELGAYVERLSVRILQQSWSDERATMVTALQRAETRIRQLRQHYDGVMGAAMDTDLKLLAGVLQAEPKGDATFPNERAAAPADLITALKDVTDVLDIFGNLGDGQMCPSAWNAAKAEDKIKAARAVLAKSRAEEGEATSEQMGGAQVAKAEQSSQVHPNSALPSRPCAHERIAELAAAFEAGPKFGSVQVGRVVYPVADTMDHAQLQALGKQQEGGAA